MKSTDMSIYRDPEVICSISSLAFTPLLQISASNFIFNLFVEMTLAVIIYYFVKVLRYYDLRIFGEWKRPQKQNKQSNEIGNN